ncbi:MAG: hypothetical protein QM811_26585 [Pirellulales bacterium]
MADETLTYLRDEGAVDVTIVNRSADRATALATKHGGKTVAWDALDEQLIAADVIVSTTGAGQPIVDAAHYRKLETARQQRPLIVLDLAIPRDFDPAIEECLNVYLYSIDDLQAACQRNRQLRDKELPKALGIVEDETARFMSDLHHRATRPIIKRLREGWQDLRDAELKRLFNKLPHLGETDRAEIEQSFERFVNKLLHPPLESLREHSKQGTPHGLIDALKRLFRLPD